MPAGGARPGAGRPPELQRQLAEAKSLALRLQGAVRAGMGKLADEYPTLIQMAIDLAKRGDEKMLHHLIDLLPRMVTLESDRQDKPISTLLQQFRVDVHMRAEEADVRVVEGEIVR